MVISDRNWRDNKKLMFVGIRLAFCLDYDKVYEKKIIYCYFNPSANEEDECLGESCVVSQWLQPLLKEEVEKKNCH